MPGDIYFNQHTDAARKRKQENAYTERIEATELKKKPGEMSFGDIVTEHGKIETSIAKKSNGKKKPQKKKRSPAVKTMMTTCITVLILLTAILLSGVAYVLSDYEVSEFTENVHVDESTLTSSPGVYNVLLMGIDTVKTETSSRSDAMILMSIDVKNATIKLSSFLRDSYVYIPGHGNMKLNAACVYGGPQLVCDTIEYNFGIRIDDYAKVGYDMFIKIIDAVGGVTIPEIDETEAKALAREGFHIDPATDVKLNGNEALLYCRIRKGQSDFYRTGRQREVITLVLKKLPVSNPLKLISAAKEIAETIECSIPKSKFIPLLFKAAFCLIGEIEQTKVPADGTWYDATKNYQSVLIVDFEENKKLLTEFLYN